MNTELHVFGDLEKNAMSSKKAKQRKESVDPKETATDSTKAKQRSRLEDHL